MPPAKKKPPSFARSARVKYASPVRRGPAPQTSQRRVFIGGVPNTTVHLLASRGDDGVDQRTLCGNWPGRPADMGPWKECPVCFRDA